jgi:transposase
MEGVMLDGSVVRAHACAAGGSEKRGGQNEQALGYSRGGFGTKLHVVVDGLGNPLRFLLTPGQAHEAPQAPALLNGYTSEFVLADKAYDAQAILATVTGMEAEAVIPPRKNRKAPRAYDRERYKERHLVECLIGKLKRFRHVFSRFDKLACNYLSFLHFAAALIWLR